MDLFSLVAKLTLDSSSYESGLSSAGEDASTFGSKIGSAFGTVTKVAGVAVTAAAGAASAIGASAVAAGSAFDTAMSQVEATMGDEAHRMIEIDGQMVDSTEALRAFAMEMGSTTAFSASEAAEALNYMALAGYDAETAMSMLPTVLDLAAAGGMDLASASDMITDTQSALGLNLDQTRELVDQMAKASSKTNTSVSQLGDAMLTIGATAKNMKGGTVELSTALGILANNGIKASEGGTHLRNMLLSLQSPTDEGAGALERLGVEVYDAEGNMRGLDEILGDLNAGMSEMTQAEKDNIIGTIFNKTDLAAASALLKDVDNDWATLTESITESTGAAETMATVQLDNLAGDITLFKSAMEGAQILISDELTPTLREFVSFGANAIGTISEAFKEGGLTGAMEALGGLLSEGLAMVIDKLPEVINAGMSLLDALIDGIIQNLPAIVDAALQIISTLGSDLLNADNIKTLLQAALDIIVQLAMGFIEALPELIPAIVDIILTIVDTLIENVDLLIDVAIALTMALAEGLINALPKLIEKIPEIVVKIVQAFIRNAPKIASAAYELVYNLSKGIASNVKLVTDKIGDFMGKVKDGFIAKVKSFTDIGKNIVDGIKEGILGAWSTLTGTVTDLAGGLVDNVKGLFGIHSPSTVFASIGGNLAAGLGVGWDDEIDGVKKDINSDLDFSAQPIAISGVTTATNNTQSQPMYANIDLAVNLDGYKIFKAVQTEALKFERATGSPAFV